MNNPLQKINLGTVQIDGTTIDLSSTDGATLINELAREDEGSLSMDFIKQKYSCNDEDLAALAANSDLVRAIALRKQQRADSGLKTHDAAVAYREQTVHVVGKIALDKMEQSRTRLQADERLQKIVESNRPETQGYQGPQFNVVVITGTPEAPTKKVISVGPSKLPLPPPDDDAPPITDAIIIDQDPPEPAPPPPPPLSAQEKAKVDFNVAVQAVGKRRAVQLALVENAAIHREFNREYWEYVEAEHRKWVNDGSAD